MSAFEDVVEAWGFKVTGDKPVVLSPAGIAPDGSIVYSDAESFRDLIGAEPELGSPSVNGWILSSSSAGVRSWVAPNAHSHAIADVTGLQAALDARMATASYPDLVAIEALAGTSGLLRKTAANTWSLDTASYALSSAIPVASSTTPSALGTAAVGTGTTWARADHVHAMPTAAQVGAAAASHSHVIADVTGLQTALDARSLTSHNHTLDSLSNTTITSIATGELLRWNGTAWVNATLAEAGIQPAGSYLTGNQTITLSGVVTGSGATAITTSIADAALSIAKTSGLQAALDAKMATASYPDLVAIEALAGTSGLLRKTAANTWSLDTASYALSSAIPVASSTTPSALGTAPVGTGTTWARADHVHAMPTAAQVGAAAASHNHDAAYLGISANAVSATKLATGRTIGITGDATWTSPSFDGTANVTAALTLASIITAGGPVGGAATVPVITYDAKGRITAVTTATITPAAIGAQPAGSYASSSHNHTLDSLSNTTITSIATGELLRWNGTAWVNATLAEAGIQPAGSYLTGNQTITLSGVVTGSGTTAITTSIADAALSIAKTSGLQSALDARMATASYPDLVAIEALAGTSGLLRKTAANTWVLDTASYALSSAIPVASSTTPSALGTAAVGTGTTWARADHVHAMPTAAQVGAAAASHSHVIADVTGLQSALDARVSIAESRVTQGTYVNSATDAMSLAARHAAGYGVHFGRWNSIAEAPRTGYFSFLMLPETKTGNTHNTLAFSNTGAIEGYIGRGSNSSTETWRRIWTDGDFSAADIAAWNAKQDALGYVPVNKAGDSGIGSLALTYGQRVKAGVDVDPTLANAYSQAPFVAEREAVSGSTYAAGIGFHNRGANAAFLYYAPDGGGFKFTRDSGTNATLWDSSNLDAVVKNPTAEQKITSYALVVERSLTNQAAFAAWIAGDALGRVALRSDGAVEWGNGAAARDTNLYRAAANLLKTDGVFFVAGGFRSNGYDNTHFPGTGPGVEVHYESANSRARVLAYDRTAAARIPLAIDGSPINFYANGVLKGSFGASGNFNLVNATASRVAVFDTSKNLVSSGTTTIELGCLSGVTSAIQPQISGKASTIDANYGYSMEGADPFASRGSYGGNGGVRTWNGAGPFGSVWYNVVDVRHRNAWNTSDVYGGELAWGMTAYTDRLAFRSRYSTGTPGAWTEVWTKANLVNPTTGTGVSGRVAYWSGTDTQTSSANLTFDGAHLYVGGGVSADTIYARSPSSLGENIRVGNASWIGDIGITNTLSIRGTSSGNVGYIKFGSDYYALGYNGSTLVYNNSAVLTASSNITFPSSSRLDISVIDVTLPDAPVGTMVVAFNTGTLDRRIYASSGTLIINRDLVGGSYEETSILVNRGGWLLVRVTSTRWVAVGAV